jgi:hypothetical protein
MANTPFNSNDFPLKQSPYYSRTYDSDVGSTFGFSNNQLVAFQPGNPLQASELNELQEKRLLDNTLNFEMLGAWAKECFSNNLDFPKWDGAIPLYPKTDTIGSDTKLVGLTQTATNTIQVQFRTGWYLVKTDAGLRTWVHYDNPGSASTFFSLAPATNYYVGLSKTEGYSGATSSNDLGDNSDGTSDPSIPGADRYIVSLSSTMYSTVSGFTGNFEPVFSFYNSGITGVTNSATYLNGLTFYP